MKIGEDDEGTPIELNRRAVESDLVIYVNINLVPMDGGHKSVGVGLCNYRTLLAHHNPKVMMKTDSYMEPKKSHLHDVVNRIGRVVNENLRIFSHRDGSQQSYV
ncbi:MAG: lactate racemase domain-containing protein [Myxococcota bacterium]